MMRMVLDILARSAPLVAMLALVLGPSMPAGASDRLAEFEQEQEAKDCTPHRTDGDGDGQETEAPSAERGPVSFVIPKAAKPAGPDGTVAPVLRHGAQLDSCRPLCGNALATAPSHQPTPSLHRPAYLAQAPPVC